MPWKTTAVCIVCVFVAFFVRGLLQKDQPSTKETSDEISRSSSSQDLPDSSPEKNSAQQQVEAPTQLQPNNIEATKKHVHHAGGHEDCPDCGILALMEKKKMPVSLAVSNLQAENSYSYVSNILGRIDGITVGHVCSESGRIDLLCTPDKANVGAIAKTLAKAGITVDGSLVIMRIDGAITPAQEQQLKTQIDNMNGVTLRSVSQKSGRLELMISNATTTQNDIAQTLRKNGHKLR